MASRSSSDDPGGGRRGIGFEDALTPEGSTSGAPKQKTAGSYTSELRKTCEEKTGTVNPKVGKNKNATSTRLQEDLNSNTGEIRVRTLKPDGIGSCQKTDDPLADVETTQPSYSKPGFDPLGTEMPEGGFEVIDGKDPTADTEEKEKHTENGKDPTPETEDTETPTCMAPEMEKENPTERHADKTTETGKETDRTGRTDTSLEDDEKKADTDAVSRKQERDDFNQDDSRGKYNSKRNGSHTQSDGGQQTSASTKENNNTEEFSNGSGPSTTNRLARVPIVGDNQTDPDTKTESASVNGVNACQGNKEESGKPPLPPPRQRRARDKMDIQIEDKHIIPVIIKNNASENEEKRVKISKDLYMKIKLALSEEGTLERISHKYSQQSGVKMLHEHGKLVLDLSEHDRNKHESKILAAIKFIELEMQNTSVITEKVSDYKTFTETHFLQRKIGGKNIYAEHFDKEGLLYICCDKSLVNKVRELVQCQIQQSPTDDSITDEQIDVTFFFSQVLERESVKAHISEAFPNVKVNASKSLENMTVALMKISGPSSEREEFKDWLEKLSENFASCSDVLKVDANQPEKSLVLPNIIQSFFSQKTGTEYIFDRTTCRIWLYSESLPQGDLEKVMKDLLKFISQETEKKPQALGKVTVQQNLVIQEHVSKNDNELSSIKEKSDSSWGAPESLLYPEKDCKGTRESASKQLKGRSCESDDSYDADQQHVVSTKVKQMTSSHDTTSESGESNVRNSGVSFASDPGSSHVVSAGKEPLYSVKCVMDRWFIQKVNGKPQMLDVFGNNLNIALQENILLLNEKYYLVGEDADGHIHIEDLSSVKKTETSLSPGPSSEVAVSSGQHSDDRGQETTLTIKDRDMEDCSDGRKPRETASADRQAVDNLDGRSSAGDIQKHPDSRNKDIKETFNDTKLESRLLQHQAEWRVSGEKWKEHENELFEKERSCVNHLVEDKGNIEDKDTSKHQNKIDPIQTAEPLSVGLARLQKGLNKEEPQDISPENLGSIKPTQTVSNKVIGQSSEIKAEYVPEQHEKVLRKKVSFNVTEMLNVTGILSTIRNECNVSVEEEQLKASSIDKSRLESVNRYTWTFPDKHTLHITHGSWRDVWKDLYVEVLPCSTPTDKIPGILEESSKNKTQMYIPVASTNAKDKHILCDAVCSVLKEARNKDFEHICIPLDETGSWDKKTFFNEIVKTIVSHFRDKETVLPVEVELTVENSNEYDFFASQAKQKLAMHTVGLKEVKEADTRLAGALMVEVVEKPLTQVKADVLVNPTSAILDLERGAVSKSLLREAGKEMDDFCKKEYPGGISAWDFAVSPNFGLRSRCVFHAAIEKYQNPASLKDLQALVSKCLDYASSLSETSIAFPAVGTGCNNFKASDVSQVMFQAVEEFNSKHAWGTTLKQMKIALLPGDSSLQDFKKKDNDYRKQLQLKKYSSLSTCVLAPAVRISGIEVFGGRGTYQTAVKSSDCVVYLWDIGKWDSVKKTHRVLNEAGQQATKDFFSHRHRSNRQQLFKTQSSTENKKSLIHVPCKGDDECLFMAFCQGIMAADECRGKSVAFFIDSDGPFYGYGKKLANSFLKGVKDAAHHLSHIRHVTMVMDDCSFLKDMQILFQQFKDEHTESYERKQNDKVRLTLRGRECDVKKAETRLNAWLSENGISADIQKGSVLSGTVSDESSSSETEIAEEAMEALPAVTRDDILTETDVNRKVNRYVLVKNVVAGSEDAVFQRICKECKGDKLKMAYLCGSKDMLLIFPSREDAEYLLQNPKLRDLKLEGFRKQALGPFTLKFGKDILKIHPDLKGELRKLDVTLRETHSTSCLNVETSYQLKCICAMISNKQSVKLNESMFLDDIEIIESPISEVSERLWDIFEEEKYELIKKFQTEFGTISCSQDTVQFDIPPEKRSTETEHIVSEVRKFFDDLKGLEFEEFSVQNIAEEAINKLDKTSSVYIKKSGKVIVYGKTYEDAKLIKHQSQVKLGIVKPTGRRRPNNTDPSVISAASETQQYFASKKEPFKISRGSLFTTEEGINIRVYVADITKLENVNCIVNAANETLSHGGGVAAAIANCAGEELEKAGRQYIRQHGKLKVGCNTFTTAGNLPYSYVIHTVGPKWSDYIPHSFDKVKNCEEDLYKAVQGSLTTAETLRMETVAVPAISSAIFGVPVDLCICQYVKATLDYSKTTGGKSSLKEIQFVDINYNIIVNIQEEFKTVLVQKKRSAYNTAKYAKERRGNFIITTSSNSHSKSFTEPAKTNFQSINKNTKSLEMYKDEMGRCIFDLANEPKKTLIVYKEDITKVPKAAIAMTIDTEGAGGKIMKGVTDEIKAHDLIQFYKKSISDGIQEKGREIGQIIVTKTFGTKYVALIHAIYPFEQQLQKEEERRKTLFQTYRHILQAALKDTEASDVALTHIGIDAKKSTEVELCAHVFLEALRSFLVEWNKKHCHLRTVHFVSMQEENVKLISTIFKKFFLEKAEAEEKEQTATEVSVDADLLDDCAICMDKVARPKQLKCGHVFCTDCIDKYFEVKKVCPNCGYVCGIITGDQPDGNMEVTFWKNSLLGFPHCGSIRITYSFPSGTQQDCHPNPGKFYRGITRTAYLPNNKEGQMILRMLRVAFQRKLTFTIGRSRTTDQDGVITWNDIHHKTDLRPYSQFGYPDPTYLSRVKEELEAKGVTEQDIPDE